MKVIGEICLSHHCSHCGVNFPGKEEIPCLPQTSTVDCACHSYFFSMLQAQIILYWHLMGHLNLINSVFYSPSLPSILHPPSLSPPASLHSSLFPSESFWSLFATTTKLFPLGRLVTSLEKLWLPSSLQQWQKLPEINSLGTGIFHHIKTFVTTTTEHGSRGHYQQQKLPTINGWTALCGNWKKHSLCA